MYNFRGPLLTIPREGLDYERYLLTILGILINEDATRAIKVKTELLLRKYGYEIGINEWIRGGI
ncbi:unnamed protein product [marine sediment metagenome]|uniref:Uncharacterized protein n=1 Tax=marine sediment metagenome TaxID=412755 RepID=X0WJR4_9ZZZZ